MPALVSLDCIHCVLASVYQDLQASGILLKVPIMEMNARLLMKAVIAKSKACNSFRLHP